MANPYEQAARERKVTRLVDALDAHLGRPCTRQDLLTFSTAVPSMDQILRKSGVKPPSQLTVDALVARIEARDAAQEMVYDARQGADD